MLQVHSIQITARQQRQIVWRARQDFIALRVLRSPQLAQWDHTVRLAALYPYNVLLGIMEKMHKQIPFLFVFNACRATIAQLALHIRLLVQWEHISLRLALDYYLFALHVLLVGHVFQRQPSRHRYDAIPVITAQADQVRQINFPAQLVPTIISPMRQVKMIVFRVLKNLRVQLALVDTMCPR